MSQPAFGLEKLWQEAHFTPNPAQEQAIRHTEGPLFITAGPGSGKTRVLLWRAVNLIVFHNVKPDEIYLSTFTEKAAKQLKEGLYSLLGDVSNITGCQYDLSKMYVGTVHSSCNKILNDRRFTPGRTRPETPALREELQQYLFLYQNWIWNDLTKAGGWARGGNEAVNALFGVRSLSHHKAVTSCITFFNRLSEELVEPEAALKHLSHGSELRPLIKMYGRYLELLKEDASCDLSLVQKAALEVIHSFAGAGSVFKHVIIDEYQDTNTVQERLFFALASGCKNLCVVGDDDQALYRFRGATVENFVQFDERTRKHFKVEPRVVELTTNYRSQDDIVRFYGEFITHATCDWKVTPKGKKLFRVPKQIEAHRATGLTAVVASDPADPETVAEEIADLVQRLIKAKKVQDPNQIAFLYPSLGSTAVPPMIAALERRGLLTYAPRAGSFLDVPEAVALFGIFFHVFGKPEASEQYGGKDLEEFFAWVDGCYKGARALLKKDLSMARYVSECRKQIAGAVRDYRIFKEVVTQRRWDWDSSYDPASMRDALANARGLSPRAKRGLMSDHFLRTVERRLGSDRPYKLRYVVNRFSALDWTILDLFYRLSGFKHFKRMYDQAARGDEGPLCNLGLISGYLDTYLDTHRPILTGETLENDSFQHQFFNSYLFTLHRRGESEYENAEDPFPRGRIPFLTIHQAKGLEFPVVVLGKPTKASNKPQPIEKMVAPLLSGTREPLERMAEFDKMRMFYVALSRPMNLLVIAHLRSAGNSPSEPFRSLLEREGFPRIRDFDVKSLPEAKVDDKDLPTTYSYTGDYLFYKRCPRNYMVFKKYGFVPSRSSTMLFGSLVHQTIEDLHQFLIERRTRP